MLIVLACLLVLGGWFVLGPTVATRSGARAEPAIDIEVQPGHPADGTGIAGALPLDEPSRPVGSGDARDDRVRCGFDQVPEFADPIPDPDGFVRELPKMAKPGGVIYAGAQRRRDAALRSTGDPFDQAVADALNVDGLRTLDDRLVTLAHDAADGSDPRIDQLAFSACFNVGAPPASGFRGVPRAGEPGIRACQQLDPRRWAAHDPGNAVPWFYVLQRADASGDVPAQQEALRQLATSSTYDLRSGAAAFAVARLPPPAEADLGGIDGLAMQAMAFELTPPVEGVITRCRDKADGDAAMAQECDSIATVLARSGEFPPRILGASIHRLATGDASLLERVKAENTELLTHWLKVRGLEEDFKKSPCDVARRTLRHFVLRGQLGQRKAMLREIETSAQP